MTQPAATMWTPEIRRPFGGREQRFALYWGQITAIEAERNVSALLLSKQIRAYAARREDIECVIRQGLLGAGLDDAEVVDLIERYVRQRPAAEGEILAWDILNAALFGAGDDDDPGNDAPAGENAADAAPPTTGSRPH